MQTVRYLPRFEEGAIAFRWTAAGVLQAWHVWEFRLGRTGREYRIFRDGFTFWEPDNRLLDGWEPNFPGYDRVDWGSIQPVQGIEEQCSEVELDYDDGPTEAELLDLYTSLT